MATVLAHDTRHGRRVAVKVLHPELAAVIGTERLLAEIRTTTTLHHPHILGLIDSGHIESIPYYVMPFVEGESLRDRPVSSMDSAVASLLLQCRGRPPWSLPSSPIATAVATADSPTRSPAGALIVTDTIFGAAPATAAMALHPPTPTPHARITIRPGRGILATGYESWPERPLC